MDRAFRCLEDLTGRARASEARGIFGGLRTRGGASLVVSNLYCIPDTYKERDRQAVC